MLDPLLNAYRFHRSTTRAARHSSPLAPNPAWDALNLARRDALDGKARYGAASPACLSRQADGLAHVDKPEALGLRHVGDVEAERYGGRDCWSRRDSCGWYTDPHGDVMTDGTGLCWGVVYQLPGRKGRARFVAGYQFGGSDSGPTLDLARVFESEPGETNPDDMARGLKAARDAAYKANNMAQKAAEAEREYQAAYAAGVKFAELGDEVADARRAALAILKERRAVKWSTPDGRPPLALCDAIRAQVAGYVQAIQHARVKRAKLAEGDGHYLVFHPDAETRAAFAEGAANG